MLTERTRQHIETFRSQVDGAVDASPGEIDTLLVMAAVQGRMHRDHPTNVRTWLLGIVQALSSGELDLTAGNTEQGDQTGSA